jgi:uncharacterized membrane protein YsdA (DUF1294 family)
MLVAAFLGFAVVNGCTMLSFWQDKQRARAGEWRISEASLLGLALIGGSPGALLARNLFRHKTRKQPFGNLLLLIVFVQAGVAIGWLVG